jgi:hypothetical protein
MRAIEDGGAGAGAKADPLTAARCSLAPALHARSGGHSTRYAARPASSTLRPFGIGPLRFEPDASRGGRQLRGDAAAGGSEALAMVRLTCVDYGFRLSALSSFRARWEADLPSPGVMIFALKRRCSASRRCADSGEAAR